MNNLIKQIVESKFNFNIDAKGNDMNSLSKSSFNSKSLKWMYEEYDYLIDLDLPSGTKWCRYNFGVDPNKLSKPEDWYGNYYVWNYKLELNNLEDLDYRDNMNAIYNFEFQIPSVDLLWELYHLTTLKWIDDYKGVKGLNGAELTSKQNYKKMFIPASGSFQYYDDNEAGIKGYLKEDVGKKGYLWSSTPDREDKANVGYLQIWQMVFNSNNLAYISIDNSWRGSFEKFPIRLVTTIKK